MAKRKSDILDVVFITKKEIKEILYWLALESGKWHKSVRRNQLGIDTVYNTLNGMLRYPITPRYWKWAGDIKDGRQNKDRL
jgi:hypothetical protein